VRANLHDRWRASRKPLVYPSAFARRADGHAFAPKAQTDGRVNPVGVGL